MDPLFCKRLKGCTIKESIEGYWESDKSHVIFLKLERLISQDSLMSEEFQEGEEFLIRTQHGTSWVQKDLWHRLLDGDYALGVVN